MNTADLDHTTARPTTLQQTAAVAGWALGLLVRGLRAIARRSERRRSVRGTLARRWRDAAPDSEIVRALIALREASRE
ncbi:MAG: hypothetical protein HKO59_05935 [Phycisphaerales bacterium]|nr:hypothetical protein [Phycisphaerales bacterium]NNM25512.1 hypothetical protein [Phycisphaerales bacterium]